ncbi:hypothetical protein CMK11_18275 [Candidatus Poribacteria bacterium]|nr:hypothetical protein [Candidatus Poribacteria bacterium]
MLTDGMEIASDVQIMILGVYHFANPGLDAVKVEVDDHLGSERQAEIVEVADALAGFSPTKVAVEHPAMEQSELSERYASYVAGSHDLGRSETEQLGFRLAARLGHETIHAIDDLGRLYMGFDRMLAYAREHDPESLGLFEAGIAAEEAEIAEESEHDGTVRAMLRRGNAPERDASGHSVYVWFTRIGAGQCYVGADVLAAWYDRNIRMFTHLARVLEDGDRVLVIVGSGHAPILRQLVSSAPGLSLADPLAYL